MSSTPAMLDAAAGPGAHSRNPHGSLVARLQAGEIQALADAYSLYHEPVRAFTQRLLGDDATAEDLVQEAFIALPRAIASYDGTCTLQTFLVAIAANRARHHVRASARRRAAMARLREEVSMPPVATPEDQIGDERLSAALFRLLDELPVDQRVAFVLCEIEERSSSECSVILGVPAATVRSRLWHAKRKLRELFTRRGLS
jgi:RNA polymerase sigma-70 factor, ECF subfamily